MSLLAQGPIYLTFFLPNHHAWFWDEKRHLQLTKRCSKNLNKNKFCWDSSLSLCLGTCEVTPSPFSLENWIYLLLPRRWYHDASWPSPCWYLTHLLVLNKTGIYPASHAYRKFPQKISLSLLRPTRNPNLTLLELLHCFHELYLYSILSLICETICIPVFDSHDITLRSSDDEKPKDDRTVAWADELSLHQPYPYLLLEKGTVVRGVSIQ
jgi:hypothetical protein